MKSFGKIFAISLLLFIFGCSSGPRTTLIPRPVAASDSMEMVMAQEPWQSRPADEVAPGFTIDISSPVDPRLNGSFKIDQDGMLKLPYDVKIDANGMTLPDLSKRINSAMSQYVKSPSVNVQVAKREYFVDVQGLVKKPGQYLVKKGATLDELISAAGGIETGSSSPSYARIDQLGVSNMVKLKDYYAGKKNLVPQWQGGEVIFFQVERGDVQSGNARNYVQLLGQVKAPGEYAFEQGSDFYDYLIKSGGPTDRADIYNLDLVRVSNNNREIVNFDMTNYKSLPAIKPGDVIFVHADNPSKLEKQSRVVGGLTGIITAIGTTVLLAISI